MHLGAAKDKFSFRDPRVVGFGRILNFFSSNHFAANQVVQLQADNDANTGY